MKLVTKLKKEANTENYIIETFVVLEIILYFSFLFLDSLNLYTMISNDIKFVAIVNCFVFVLVWFIRNKEKSILIMLFILCFTVLADVFLLFTQKDEIGIFFFIIVQILYSLKLKSMCKDNCKIYMLEFFAVTFVWNIVILILKSKNDLTPVIVLASSYFVIFTANLIKSWFYVAKCKNRTIIEISFVIGLLLFYFCDLNVGLHNIGDIGIELPSRLMEELSRISGILMWFFYLPSQVILSIHCVLYRQEY